MGLEREIRGCEGEEGVSAGCMEVLEGSREKHMAGQESEWECIYGFLGLGLIFRLKLGGNGLGRNELQINVT